MYMHTDIFIYTYTYRYAYLVVALVGFRYGRAPSRCLVSILCRSLERPLTASDVSSGAAPSPCTTACWFVSARLLSASTRPLLAAPAGQLLAASASAY